MKNTSRFLCTSFLLVTGTVLAGAGTREGDPLETSVNRGLAFLKSMQERSGYWRLSNDENPGATGLAVMAFLSAGHVPGEGPYGQVVEKGIRAVLKNQQASGLLSPSNVYEMYHHGICTLMLAEAAGMTDAKLSEEIRRSIEKAVALILKAQNMSDNSSRGGWRYYVNSPDADLSVTGWQILALKAARNLGCDVPSERIDLALGFVMGCWDAKEGGFCYTPNGSVTLSCTGTGVLALQLCSNDRLSKQSLQGGSYLLKNRLRPDEMYFHYGHYYASQATFQLGKNYWNSFRPYLHKVLFAGQQPNGSWLDIEGLGPNYATAMSILALTVEYRFLPLYQRPEE